MKRITERINGGYNAGLEGVTVSVVDKSHHFRSLSNQTYNIVVIQHIVQLVLCIQIVAKLSASSFHLYRTNMQIIEINPNITAFYFGAETNPENLDTTAPGKDDWVDGACHTLGVACYAIHNADSCIVFDTLCSPDQANEIKVLLEQKLGFKKFIVVNSHWHLHHIGGNELYKDSCIVGTRKTRAQLLSQKAEIESGTSSWGPPAIECVRPPDIVFDDNLSIFLDDLEVLLISINIHSQDSLCAYIPKYKILLASDMVEDTIPFVTDPGDIPDHLRNYDQLRGMDIEKMLPNHCRLKPLQQGGYAADLIESSAYYLKNLYEQVKADLDAQIPDLKTFMREYLKNGTVTYWHPYEHIHENNIEKVKKHFRKM